MKKPRSNFVVEYKGARRKPQSKPKSIWGEVDLRSYADGVDDAGRMNGAYNRQGSSTPPDVPDVKVLGRYSAGEQPVNATSETHEPRQDLDLKAAIPRAAQLVRKTESKKLSSNPVLPSVEGAAGQSPPPVREPTKRGPKRSADSADRTTDIAFILTKASTRKAGKTKLYHPEPQAASGDEMDDLGQLELENARLRKLLTEKLRSENALLRQLLRQV